MPALAARAVHLPPDHPLQLLPIPVTRDASPVTIFCPRTPPPRARGSGASIWPMYAMRGQSLQSSGGLAPRNTGPLGLAFVHSVEAIGEKNPDDRGRTGRIENRPRDNAAILFGDDYTYGDTALSVGQNPSRKKTRRRKPPLHPPPSSSAYGKQVLLGSKQDHYQRF